MCRLRCLRLRGGLQAVEVKIVWVSMALLAVVLTRIDRHFSGLREAVETWFDRGLVACAGRVSSMHRDHASAAQSEYRSGGGLRGLQNLELFQVSVGGVGCHDDGACRVCA